jgi:hypothetical protein
MEEVEASDRHERVSVRVCRSLVAWSSERELRWEDKVYLTVSNEEKGCYGNGRTADGLGTSRVFKVLVVLSLGHPLLQHL